MNRKMAGILLSTIIAAWSVAGCGQQSTGNTASSAAQTQGSASSAAEEDTTAETAASLLTESNAEDIAASDSTGEDAANARTEEEETAEGLGVLTVTGGQISGIQTDTAGVMAYEGIPYAAAPVGDLRWKAPQDVESWNGVKACDQFGPCAMQSWADFSQPWMGCYTQEFEIEEGKDTISEDCLYLNVWTNATSADEKLPVIVFFHGGGYGQGSGSIASYNGEEIAAKGAVFVTVNYRLGIFGFLTTPELDEESETGTSGDYGLLDSIKSLEWVQDNIAQFGGDPDNVTIAGQSAGGISIDVLVASPLSKGLFQNAVVFSGNHLGTSSGRSFTHTKKKCQVHVNK